MPRIHCTECGLVYPITQTPFICQNCGGVFDFDADFDIDLQHLDPTLPGIWRFGLAHEPGLETPVVSLGEGNTPLIWTEQRGLKIGLKCEHLNPTGSYKDRGSTVLVSHLVARGVKSVIEDSSGNAGASFAAYAARAGIHVSVYIPSSASGPKKLQIQKVSAEIIEVPGPRSAAAQAVRERANQGIVYASHAYLPFGLRGIATIAYELFLQAGIVPGSIIAPVGHGGLLLGIMRGFQALLSAGIIQQVPYYVGVQAKGCSPVVQAFEKGSLITGDFVEKPTIAEGVKVRTPVRASAILKAISEGRGEMVSIEEQQLLMDHADLARKGFYVEPTSGLVWSACRKAGPNLPQPMVAILTGSGLKYMDSSERTM